jgi:hypothetical protein
LGTGCRACLGAVSRIPALAAARKARNSPRPTAPRRELLRTGTVRHPRMMEIRTRAPVRPPCRTSIIPEAAAAAEGRRRAAGLRSTSSPVWVAACGRLAGAALGSACLAAGRGGSEGAGSGASWLALSPTTLSTSSTFFEEPASGASWAGIGTTTAVPHLGNLVLRPARLSGARNFAAQDGQATRMGMSAPR